MSRRRPRRGRWGAAAAMAVGLLAGCGGPLSSGDLHNQATSICQTAQHGVQSIATPSSPAETVTFLGRGIALLSPELTQLRALQPPTEAAAKYHEALRSFSAQLSSLRAARQNLRTGQDPVITLKTLENTLAPLRDIENRDWDQLGIPACLSR